MTDYEAEGVSPQQKIQLAPNSSVKLNALADSVETSFRDTLQMSNIYKSKINNDENSSSFANDGLRSQDRRELRTAPLKHYEVPNLTSMLYEYTNREKDTVQSAFRGGNY